MNISKLGLVAGAITLGVLACQAVGRDGKTSVGQTVKLGNGTIHSWTHTDAKGKIESVGVTFSASALTGLPKAKTKSYEESYMYLLHLPKIEGCPFKEMMVDYNPNGHIPEHIYTVPHFDFHFYMVSNDERMSFTLDGGGMKKCQKKPDSAYFPKGYMYGPGSEVPMMGAHWVDTASHEFHGKPFDTTLIYGSYNGKVVFVEPMVTIKYLQSKPAFTAPIPQPAKLETGVKTWPTKYSVKYDAAKKEYTVMLSGFKSK